MGDRQCLLLLVVVLSCVLFPFSSSARTLPSTRVADVNKQIQDEGGIVEYYVAPDILPQNILYVRGGDEPLERLVARQHDSEVGEFPKLEQVVDRFEEVAALYGGPMVIKRNVGPTSGSWVFFRDPYRAGIRRVYASRDPDSVEPSDAINRFVKSKKGKRKFRYFSTAVAFKIPQDMIRPTLIPMELSWTLHRDVRPLPEEGYPRSASYTKVDALEEIRMSVSDQPKQLNSPGDDDAFAGNQLMGGNFVVSPPTRPTGTEFGCENGGCIVYGENAARTIRNSILRSVQLVHGVMPQGWIEINTKWLNPGHADELVQFVPHGNSDDRMSILLADAQLGQRLLMCSNLGLESMDEIIKCGKSGDSYVRMSPLKKKEEMDSKRLKPLTLKLLKRMNTPRIEDPPLDKDHEKLNGIFVYPPRPDMSKGKFNFKYIRDVAADEKFQLCEETPGLTETQTKLRKAGYTAPKYLYVSVPVMFWACDDRYVAAGTFMLPDMVNNVLINTPEAYHLVVPHPLGPIQHGQFVFAEYMRREMDAIGVKLSFINTVFHYHSGNGQIHCGSNGFPKVETSFDPSDWSSFLGRRPMKKPLTPSEQLDARTDELYRKLTRFFDPDTGVWSLSPNLVKVYGTFPSRKRDVQDPVLDDNDDLAESIQNLFFSSLNGKMS